MQILVKDIRPNPLQPRSKPCVSELVTSMAKVGLIQPIVVTKNGKGYIVVAGHRRLAAAKALDWETVECNVIDAADPKLDIGRIMAENMVRTDLTGHEQAAGFQTMIDLGYTDEEIQAASNASTDEVKAARAIATGKKKVVAKMPETASLLEMAGLLEFEGTEVYDDLLGAVGTDNFEHQLELKRQNRARLAKVEASRIELTDAGVRIIPVSTTWDGSALRLDNWQLEKLKLTPKKHAECPGHCAFITHEGDIVYSCDQPELHGVKRSGTTGPKTEEQKAADKLKREMRALWRASTTIRTTFAATKVNSKKPDTKLVRWALDYATAVGIPGFDGHNVRAKDYTDSTDGLIRFLAICVWQMEKAIDDWVKYQGAVGGGVRFQQEYLAMLVELKYKASDHELAIINGEVFEPSAP
jgi:ParB/RepB/Spo0J family partition protein